jgi:hypothetical protein
MPPRRGSERCKVEEEVRESEARVALGERCLPAKTRRRSCWGMLVRRARRERRVEIEVVVGRVSGITKDGFVSPATEAIHGTDVNGKWRVPIWRSSLLPAMFLTKIWIVSVESDDDDEIDDSDDTLFDRLVRMLTVCFDARVLCSFC